jgi:hypothetical protein
MGLSQLHGYFGALRSPSSHPALSEFIGSIKPKVSRMSCWEELAMSCHPICEGLSATYSNKLAPCGAKNIAAAATGKSGRNQSERWGSLASEMGQTWKNSA